MLKKVLLSMLICSFLSITTVFATDNPKPIKVFIQGEQLTFSEQPFIENDVTLVQFRPIFEKLGLTIEWNDETNTIIGRKDDLVIKLTIGSVIAIVNDEVKTLVLAPRIVNNVTFVPLRFVGEASGSKVSWDGVNKNIWIRDSTPDIIGVEVTPSPVPTSTISPSPTPNPEVTPTATPLPTSTSTPIPTSTPLPTPSPYAVARNTQLLNELATLQQALTNVQNEKNVKLFQDGEFIWVADPTKVEQAKTAYTTALDYYNTWKTIWGF